VKSKKASVPAKIDIGLSHSVLFLLIQSYFVAGGMTPTPEISARQT
jgi:hypothetical protein